MPETGFPRTVRMGNPAPVKNVYVACAYTVGGRLPLFLVTPRRGELPVMTILGSCRYQSFSETHRKEKSGDSKSLGLLLALFTNHPGGPGTSLAPLITLHIW